MHVTALWHPGLRIMAFGPRAGALGEALIRSGYQQFLAVVGDRQSLEKMTSALSAGAGPRDGRPVVGRGPQEQCRGAGARWRSRLASRPVPFGAPRFLGCGAAGLSQCSIRLGDRAAAVSARSFHPPNDRQREAGRRASAALARFRQPAAACGFGAAYIPHALGVERFLKRLRGQRLRHAVLRWFDELPNLPPGEDVDLLVDDECLDAVGAMLDEGPGLQPIDVYSVSGLPGSDYCQMPYFPPPVAAGILDRACNHRELCFVPSPEDHFLSLAYHALYHKGAKSGLPVADGDKPGGRRAEHDYLGILQRMARRLNLDVRITLADLDRLLDARHWRPPHDMLVRLARRNAWVGSLVSAVHEADTDPGLAVFLLRQAALERGGIARASALIARHGFLVIHSQVLDDCLAQAVAPCLRGGNWGRGPWPLSGGPPAAAIVAYDFEPIRPSRKQRKKHPFLANARLLCKAAIRDEFNAGLPADRHCNVVHSSDNGREALDYLRAILGDGVEAMLTRIAELRNQDPTLTARPATARPQFDGARRAA